MNRDSDPSTERSTSPPAPDSPMPSRLTLAFTLAALALLCVAAPASAVDPPDRRRPVQEFALDDLSGDAVRLSDFAGKVVVISFWATWCGPCLQELPFLQQLYDQHGGELVVLAITTDGPDTVPEVRNIVRRNRWTMPVLLDLDGGLMAQLNPRGTQPFTMFIDRQGRLAHVHEGYSVGDEVAHAASIETLVGE